MTAQSGIEFLTGSSTLSAIVKKYSRGLGEHYNTLNWQYLEGISEDKLRILSEIEAADNAVPILNAYIYRKFKFHSDNRPRKITGLFSSEFKGEKFPLLIIRRFVKVLRHLFLAFGLIYIILRLQVGRSLRNLNQVG